MYESQMNGEVEVEKKFGTLKLSQNVHHFQFHQTSNSKYMITLLEVW